MSTDGVYLHGTHNLVEQPATTTTISEHPEERLELKTSV
jgi:hypothetical protein